MNAAQLIRRLQEQRESWCVLREEGDGQAELAVLIRRPPEAELADLHPSASGQKLSEALSRAACTTVVGWRGMTEADLFGAAIGSSDPLDFDAGVWAEVARDRADWLAMCAEHLTLAIGKHLEEKVARAKN